MLAALVGTGRRDGELARLDDGGDSVTGERVLDPDPPGVGGEGAASEPDVAARVDRVVRQPGRLEDVRRPVDRPALHEPGRVEPAARLGAMVEVAARLGGEAPRSGRGSRGPAGARRSGASSPRVEAADLAVRLEGAERLVDPAEPREDVVERLRRDAVVADVHDDRHSHHVLDATQSGRDGGRCAHALFALTSASWSDCANASLV